MIETETLKDEHTKQLNDFFGEFWKENIGKEEKTADILTFVILQKNRFTACKTDSGRGEWLAHVQEPIPPGCNIQ